MNLDRFGMKAISQRTNKWVFANCIESCKDCFGILWRYNRREVYRTACVYPETICQCTGLRDSDGKLIYENDYVSVGAHGKDNPCCIVNYKGICAFDVQYPDGVVHSLATLQWLMEKDKDFMVKVVGNKFDKEEQGE